MLLKQGKKVILRKTTIDECNLIEQTEVHPDNTPFIGHWSLEEHVDSLNNLDHLRITISNIKDEFCGFVILRGMDNYKESIEIKRIVVTKKGEGLGRETLNLLKSLAFEDYNTKHLFLSTRTENVRAIHLYTSAGFIAEAERPTVFHMYKDDYFEKSHIEDSLKISCRE